MNDHLKKINNFKRKHRILRLKEIYNFTEDEICEVATQTPLNSDFIRLSYSLRNNRQIFKMLLH